MDTIFHTVSAAKEDLDIFIPLNMDQLHAGLDHILLSPREVGILELIVRRPGVDMREILPQGRLDVQEGLVGDSWSKRKSSRSAEGGPHPDMQLNIMNARAIDLIARSRDRWALAGDQLFIDMDLSDDNLPPGTRLSIGSAVIEVTAQPHNGCKKFVQRYGLDAMKFVNSAIGKKHHLRGINARVVQSGVITANDHVIKL